MTEPVLEDKLEEKILGALARGYCSKCNERKVLDIDLIKAMTAEVMLALAEIDNPVFV